MNRTVILDTGPLVALLNSREHHHPWARRQFAEIEPPLLTCEPVLTEACYLLRNAPGGLETVLEFLRRGALEVRFELAREAEPVKMIQHRYADLPMSLADACLVRMAELHAGSSVLTIDSDFYVYRMHGRQVIPTLLPETQERS